MDGSTSVSFVIVVMVLVVVFVVVFIAATFILGRFGGDGYGSKIGHTHLGQCEMYCHGPGAVVRCPRFVVMRWYARSGRHTPWPRTVKRKAVARRRGVPCFVSLGPTNVS